MKNLKIHWVDTVMLSMERMGKEFMQDGVIVPKILRRNKTQNDDRKGSNLQKWYGGTLRNTKRDFNKECT